MKAIVYYNYGPDFIKYEVIEKPSIGDDEIERESMAQADSRGLNPRKSALSA